MSIFTSFLNFLLIIYFALLINSQEISCSGCIELSFYYCQICFNSCQQQEMKLQKCTQIRCAQQYHDGDCYRHQTVQIPKQQCLSRCCNQGLPSYEFTFENIQTCKQSNDTSSILSIVIPVGIFLIIFIACVCCSCRDTDGSERCQMFENICMGILFIISCGFCFRCLREDDDEAQPQQPAVQNSISQLNNYNKWKVDETHQAINMNEDNRICSICLFQNINTITTCLHGFHHECIGDWFQKKRSCPNCLNQNISIVRIYCKICMLRYLQINLNSYNYNRTYFQQNKEWQACQLCQSSI